MATLYDGSTFEHEGLTFRVAFPYDHDSSPPWEREDGHGSVSNWTLRERTADGYRKGPHERILCSDNRSVRLYDVHESVRIARRDGWGLSPADMDALRAKLCAEPKPGAIAARAVELDFERLRDWCDDKWGYVGVVVTLLDVDGNATDENQSLWGIESDSSEYLTETAHDLASEIAARIGTREEIPARPASYRVRKLRLTVANNAI